MGNFNISIKLVLMILINFNILVKSNPVFTHIYMKPDFDLIFLFDYNHRVSGDPDLKSRSGSVLIKQGLTKLSSCLLVLWFHSLLTICCEWHSDHKRDHQDFKIIFFFLTFESWHLVLKIKQLISIDYFLFNRVSFCNACTHTAHLTQPTHGE